MKKTRYIGIAAATIMAIAPTVVTTNTVALAADAANNTEKVQNDNKQVQGDQSTTAADGKAALNDAPQGSDTIAPASLNAPTDTIAPAGFLTDIAGQGFNLVSGWFTAAGQHAAGAVQHEGEKLALGMVNGVIKLIESYITEAGNRIYTIINNATGGLFGAGVGLAQHVENLVTSGLGFQHWHLEKIDGIPLDKALSDFHGLTFSDNVDKNKFNQLKKVYGKPITHANVSDYNNLKLVENFKIDDQSADKIWQAIDKKGYTIQFGVAGGENDFQTQIDDAARYGNGASFSVPVFLSKDGEQLATTMMNFTNKGADNTPTSSLNINFQVPYYVGVGTSTTDAKTSKGIGAKVTDQSGSALQYTPQFSQFYTNENDAKVAGPKGMFFEPTFTKNGDKFYQKVTLNFNNKDKVNIAQLMSNMNYDKSQVVRINGVNASGIDVDDKTNSVSFVRTVIVGQNQNINSQQQPNLQQPDQQQSHNLIADTANWLIHKVFGTVLVKSTKADLMNDADERTTRGIAPNTGWAIDQVRTNKDTNEVEYRVSTHEWVKASDVTMEQKQGNQATTNKLGNIENFSGKKFVKLGDSANYIYHLFGPQGNQWKRDLGAGTTWFTDKKATDDKGNTYYRVSTNEWVAQGDGVTLTD
jgi:hypothetical protein